MGSDTTMVHAKVRKTVKDRAMETARALGVPLSLVVEQSLRRFAEDHHLLVEESTLKPTPYLEKILSEAQKNRYNPKYWSGPFTTAGEWKKHLRGLMASAK